MKLSLSQKLTLGALSLLVASMAVALVIGGIKHWQLTKELEEIAAEYDQKLEDKKAGYYGIIEAQADTLAQQDSILLISAVRFDSLLRANTFDAQTTKSHDEINSMDDAALLNELKGIRAAYHLD